MKVLVVLCVLITITYCFAAKLSGVNNVCPDGSSCPGVDTCCPIISGGQGCCPYPNGVCCSDLVHCCPASYICLLGTCFLATNATASVKLSQPNQICPTGEICPGSETCCPVGPQSSACCPYPNAACCSDGLHCCPMGTTCNLAQQTCDKIDKMEVLKGLREDGKVEGNTEDNSISVNIVPCPGGQYACPDGNTCCQLASGEWGCCPLPRANCCPDKVHCCPSGSTCTGSQCQYANNHAVPFYNKVPAIPMIGFREVGKVEGNSTTVNIVPCPGGQYACPDGNTCCQLASGEWGCCPLPRANCCPDKVHCCPSGSTCTGSQCQYANNHAVPFYNKVPAIPMIGFREVGKVEDNVEDNSISANIVPCPGGQYACPDGNTCCQLASGEWGCCPLPRANCCPDKVHCCPSGTRCTGSQCQYANNHAVPFYNKVPAIPMVKQLKP